MTRIDIRTAPWTAGLHVTRQIGRMASVVAVQASAWHERRRQRRALLSLDDHMLKDLGLTRADAWREGRKPFWEI
ncbi:MAG: DUF1127 domain-containing protein [Geminicoccaceae bacterium]